MSKTAPHPVNPKLVSPHPINIGNVLEAQQRLSPYLKTTPLHYAERFGCWLKLENLQRTGSYKVRGALNALLVAQEQGDTRPVIAASAGNHAQGLAWAGHKLSRPVVTVMPETAPHTKIQGVARWGAKVVLHGQNYDQAKAHAHSLAKQNHYALLPAFDDPHVIAGQGTIGLELGSLAPDVVFVPIGGGGLAAGMALVLKAQGIRVIGVQVEDVDAMTRALRGHPQLTEPAITLADGIRVKEAGKLTFQMLENVLDDLILLTEQEVRETLVRLALEEHIIAEGAGVLALAASQKIKDQNIKGNQRKCAIVSGGNIDAGVLGPLLAAVPQPSELVTVMREEVRGAVGRGL